MAAASSVVIKVKYEDTLRRFRAQIINGELSLTADELRKKIISLFEFSSDSEIMLTYIDEDGDTVTLVDSADLSDVVNQCLNPIRFTVVPVSENDATKFNPQQSFDPNILPQQHQHLLKNLVSDDIPKLVRSLPEPTLETFDMVIIDDLVSKYGIVNIADYLLKLSESETKKAKVKKQNSCGSFNPLNLPPTPEKDARRKNNSSAQFVPSSFLPDQHQQHPSPFGNAHLFPNIFPEAMHYPDESFMSVTDRFSDLIQDGSPFGNTKLLPRSFMSRAGRFSDRIQDRCPFGNGKLFPNIFPEAMRYPDESIMSLADRFSNLIQADQKLLFLSRLRPEKRRLFLGEKLFPLVRELEPREAAKVTEMLLELENAEILNLLQDTSAMRTRVDEAMEEILRKDQMTANDSAAADSI